MAKKFDIYKNNVDAMDWNYSVYAVNEDEEEEHSVDEYLGTVDENELFALLIFNTSAEGYIYGNVSDITFFECVEIIADRKENYLDDGTEEEFDEEFKYKPFAFIATCKINSEGEFVVVDTF